MMIKKKDQTYEWACAQMNKRFNDVKLKDISKKFWTQELLEAAIKHGNATINEIPRENLTKEMCVECMRIFGGSYIAYVPEELLSFDMLLNQISEQPQSFDDIFNFYRRGRWSAPVTKEDLALIQEALCPRIWGEEYIATQRAHPKTAGEAIFASDSEKMDYIAKAALSKNNSAVRYCIPYEVIWNSFKHTYMSEDAPAKEDKAGENIAFYLPDGCYIKTETHSGDVNAHESDERNWDALDVYLVDRDGKKDLLCSVDYEDQKGLRVLVYDEGSEYPVYKHPADIGTECKKAGQVAPQKISVDTLFGKLEACIGGNPEDYPTIFTYIVRPDGVEVDLVSCEVKCEEEIAQAYLYGDPETMDWTKSHQWTKDAILGQSEETNAEANNVEESTDTIAHDESTEVCLDDKEQNLQVVKDMVKSCQDALKKLAYGNDYEVSSRADEIFSLTIDELELLIKEAGQ